MNNLLSKSIAFFAVIFSVLTSSFTSSMAQEINNKSSAKKVENVYDFSFVKLIEQSEFKLSEYRNKVLLIVNTASKCGFTKQYEGLEKLHQKYHQRGLVIIGVPSADFGNQEFLSNQEIKNFCKFNYGVNFLMTQKEVVTGDKAHPFYLYAREQLGFLASPKWNFHKYLINREGKLINYFISSTEPMSDKVIKAIEKELE